MANPVVSGAQPAAAKPAAAAPTAPQSNESIIYQWLRNFGFSPAQSAGVLGNFQVESGFNPNGPAGDNGTSFGIAQWHLGRHDAEVAYANANHLDPTGLQAQLGYLGQELTGPYAGTTAAVKGQSTAAGAASVFSTGFEGNTPDSIPLRQQFATQIYGQLQAGQPLTGGPSTNAPIGGYSGGGGKVGFGSSVSFQSGQLPGGAWDPLNWPGDALGAVGNAAGSVASGIATEVEQWAEKVFHALFTFLINATCVVVGLICLYQGYKLVATSEDEDTGAGPAANPTSASDNTEKEVAKEDSGGGGEGGGLEEDAAAA